MDHFADDLVDLSGSPPGRRRHKRDQEFGRVYLTEKIVRCPRAGKTFLSATQVLHIEISDDNQGPGRHGSRTQSVPYVTYHVYTTAAGQSGSATTVKASKLAPERVSHKIRRPVRPELELCLVRPYVPNSWFGLVIRTLHCTLLASPARR